ncbi:MAG: tyrosine-type recombinase/integrase, partial [Acetobacteraceae bacterium]|nr:tyrosine-type recombinase/integrase [Acetobacteraceae bacterium]
GLRRRDDKAPLWADAVRRWMTEKLAGRKPSTQQRYLVSLRQLHPHLADLPIAAIDQPTLNDYVVARMGAGVTAATVRRDLNVVSGVWRVARRAGWVQGTNPARAELEEIEELRDPARPVPLRDLALVIRQASGLARDLIRFLARTGCRQEEAASLEWREVNLRADPPTVTFLDTKTRAPRVIELPPQVARDLRRLPRDPRTTYVFWHPFGKGGPDRYRQFATVFWGLVRETAEAAAAAGGPRRSGRSAGFQPFRCHDLRHTFAVRWLEKGGDIYALSRHLGHSTVDTTDRVYGAWLRRERRRARA